MKRRSGRQRRVWRIPRKVVIAGLLVVAVFVVVNAVLWAVYRQRTYPRTSIGNVKIGSVAYDQLAQKASDLELLPEQIMLRYPLQEEKVKSPIDNPGMEDQKVEQQITLKADEIGLYVDTRRTTDSANKQRSWLPIINLFQAPKLRMPVNIDEKKLDAQRLLLAKSLYRDPVNARLYLDGTTVSIAEGTRGFRLNQAALQQALLAGIDENKTQITAPVHNMQPKVKAKALKDKKSDLEQQLKTTVTYTYQGKSKKVSASDVATWYVPEGEVYAVSPEKLQAYIVTTGKSFGMRVKNLAAVVSATQQALNKRQALQAELTHQPALKTYTYCTAVRGVDASYLSALRPRLQSAFTDPRGWSLDGLVELKEGASGCDFTVWLTAAAMMPTFGAICDAMWSCRVGPNVVINFDRWQNASPAWNESGGALEEYRNMVINHETGHWFGFGHSHCSGAGQLAPVMQQQSIDLQGCRFNAWPTPAELAGLRRTLGI